MIGTFHSEYRLLFRLLFLDTLQESNHKLCFFPTNLVLRILRSQYVYVVFVARFPSQHCTAFPGQYLFDSVCELGSPCLPRIVYAIATKDIVDGANTILLISTDCFIRQEKRRVASFRKTKHANVGAAFLPERRLITELVLIV